MAGHRVSRVNHRIFRQCREQIGLSIEQAQKKASITTLGKIEAGKIKPTFRQLEKLAGLCHVPPWVFLRDELPEQYDFGRHMPSFRRFAADSPIFSDHQIRVITASVERFRELILELRSDMEEPIEPFSPPRFNADIPTLARTARAWLGRVRGNYGFQDWKKAFEEKDIFVFLTSKYKSWSKAAPSLFRGFSIHKNVLPIIVINDSDAKAAQSFTLWHELGHLLRRESVMDSDHSSHAQQEAEALCSRFAGEALMPEAAFVQAVQGIEITDQAEEALPAIDKTAKDFKVSRYACAVRMLQLRIIKRKQYNEIASSLEERRQRALKDRQDKETKIQRNTAKEKLHQYGGIYSRCVMQAYHNREIGLHKLCRLFGIKKAVDAKQLEGLI